ncbi:hypothetical protein CYMTET_5497 [Cymbomonas tetramitiformis]|uniref:D-alanyl-D-alanine carboxypeptidase-like core domain-containing protein n=1 Tax=Cymbomonas tetramitiformis TaxID=36881 RepID=A0AAE0GZ18_9CHLO|nr:hypothetical protein CYMTET_5497 [Cymbomonas tetramitiformis]
MNFEHTRAGRWLRENAVRYHFEMSFPRDNPDGVAYEPWHYRFMGDTTSLKLFTRHETEQRELLYITILSWLT